MPTDEEEAIVSEHPADQALDDVLAAMADLDGRPLSDHVAVFEAAHDRLRDVLARAADDNRPT